jgi:hypothetical protein
MKKPNSFCSTVLGISLILFSSIASAAPNGIISLYYYKTSAKQELIGYWYQSCYLGFSSSWGTKQGFSVPDPGMHGKDCTQLGSYGNNKGYCLSSQFSNTAVERYYFDGYTNTWESYDYVESDMIGVVRGECEGGMNPSGP